MIPVVLDCGVLQTPVVNLPFVTLTLCTPGSSTQCRTIDHILLDTGSSGLRLVASVLSNGSPALGLPQVTNPAGNPLTECLQFVDGSAYGSVRMADVVLGDETLSSLPIQLIGDPAYPSVPSNCTGVPENTVAAFGANGVLGVSTFLLDCGAICAANVAYSNYYQCPSGQSCTSTTVTTNLQVANPVARRAQDNNGVIVQLPAVGDDGAVSAQGVLVFGIATRSNNALATSLVLQLDGSGMLTTTYAGHTLNQSFFDTGSNFLFFPDSTLAQCTQSGFAGFYCPATTQALSAVVTGGNGNSASIGFKVGNAHSLVANNSTYTVFSDIAADVSLSSSFDWGLPFYLGRTVYTAFQGQAVSGVTGTLGPWISF